MKNEIENLKMQVEVLKKKKQYFEEKNKLKEEIITLKKGFNVFAQFNPFRNVEVKENLKEIWSPIKYYLVGMKREQLREQRRQDWLLNQ